MGLSIPQKDFLVDFYHKLLNNNKYVFICFYPNSDKSLIKLRKSLFKQKIYIEVLATKVFSRNIFPLAGPHFLILINNLDQLSLIPPKYLQMCRMVVTYNTVYPYSLFLAAQSFNKVQPQPYKYCFKYFEKSIKPISNLQLNIIKNTIFCLNNAHR